MARYERYIRWDTPCAAHVAAAGSIPRRAHRATRPTGVTGVKVGLDRQLHPIHTPECSLFAERRRSLAEQNARARISQRISSAAHGRTSIYIGRDNPLCVSVSAAEYILWTIPNKFRQFTQSESEDMLCRIMHMGSTRANILRISVRICVLARCASHQRKSAARATCVDRRCACRFSNLCVRVFLES